MQEDAGGGVKTSKRCSSRSRGRSLPSSASGTAAMRSLPSLGRARAADCRAPAAKEAVATGATAAGAAEAGRAESRARAETSGKARDEPASRNLAHLGAPFEVVDLGEKKRSKWRYSKVEAADTGLGCWTNEAGQSRRTNAPPATIPAARILLCRTPPETGGGERRAYRPLPNRSLPVQTPCRR